MTTVNESPSTSTATSAESETEIGAAPAATCPPPANFRKVADDYDRDARVGVWSGPRYKMTYRVLGQGPPLILLPGVSSTYRGYLLTLRQLSERFTTVVYDYPGDHPDDGAALGSITHDHLADDLFGLIDHLNFGRVFLFGLSFGSTVVLKSLAREPRRFPRAAVQGAFARRKFTIPEKLALWVGRRIPGRSRNLPLHDTILTLNSKSHFPMILESRFRYYLDENGRTPIRALAHRLDLVSRLDLRPMLPRITTPLLLVHGREDRIVPERSFEELRSAVPSATGLLVPLVGHQPHFTHAELLAKTVGDWLLPCAPEGCPSEPKG